MSFSPSHTSLKHRHSGQGTEAETKEKDFRKELEEREREARFQKEKNRERRTDRQQTQATAALEDLVSRPSSSKKAKVDGGAAPAANLDADDPIEDDASADDDSDSDSDDDDTAALMAELQKIKSEKAMEHMEREDDRRAEDEQIRMENILKGNPLLKERYSGTAEKSDLRVKRRWDDDVVFKNCSRAAPEKQEQVFINDSLRSVFHRKFMDKYIK